MKQTCFLHYKKSKCLQWSGFSLQGSINATLYCATLQSTCQSRLTAHRTILYFVTVSCNVISHTAFSLTLSTPSAVTIDLQKWRVIMTAETMQTLQFKRILNSKYALQIIHTAPLTSLTLDIHTLMAETSNTVLTHRMAKEDICIWSCVGQWLTVWPQLHQQASPLIVSVQIQMIF